MSEELYLVSVGDVFGYNPVTGDLLFQSKTEVDNSIAISATAKEIRGGKGDVLRYVYYSTAKFAITLKDAQFELPMIAGTVGSTITTNNGLYEEESVTLSSGGAGTVVGAISADPYTGVDYVWVTDQNGVTTKLIASGQTFILPGGVSGEQVCVRYYTQNSAARQVVVPANIIPGIVHLVIEAQLASNKEGSGIVGKLSIDIPRAQYDGSNTLTLSSNSVSTTDLKMNALAYVDAVNGCSTSGIYAKLTQVVYSNNWYDNVNLLAIADDTVAVNTATPTYQLVIYAVPTTGAAFVAPVSDLTFASDNVTDVTVSASGLVSKVAAGSANISVKITAKPTVSTTVAVIAS